MKQPRQLIDAGNGTVFVPLTRGHVAAVDSADADLVGRWNWSSDVCPTRRAVYGKRTERVDGVKRIVLLHRFLWSAWGMEPAAEIDHADGDGLNNRRANLRAATTQQNAANRSANARSRSGRKGVSFITKTGKWVARVGFDGRDVHLGSFDSIDEASRAYERAVQARFGEFARAS